MARPAPGLALEFDGAQHREREQHRADNVREEKLERRGLILVRADTTDISRYRSELCDRITAARVTVYAGTAAVIGGPSSSRPAGSGCPRELSGREPTPPPPVEVEYLPIGDGWSAGEAALGANAKAPEPTPLPPSVGTALV